MMNKINQLTIATYLSVTSFFRNLKDIKDDERGLSDIVTTVLLILVAVLAVVLVWGLLSGWLQDLWSRITGEADKIK